MVFFVLSLIAFSHTSGATILFSVIGVILAFAHSMHMSDAFNLLTVYNVYLINVMYRFGSG